MRLRYRLAGLLVAAAMLGLTGPAAASDKDTREISAYALTESGLAKFKQATQNLAAVPGGCARTDDDDDSDSKSIDEMVAKMNAVPGAAAAIQSAGMTTREFVVFTFSMFQTGMAAWAVGQPGGKLPPGVSQANVDFYKKHEAKLAALGENDPCDDATADEEEETPEE
jgi:hypothetical protein